jgi:hypothetical protein
MTAIEGSELSSRVKIGPIDKTQNTNSRWLKLIILFNYYPFIIAAK